MRLKKISAAAAIIAIIISVAASLSVSVYAIWQTQSEADLILEVPVDEYNPSLKHLIFYALDADGNFTEGDAVSYAAVGYDGLVAEVNIPSEYQGLPVTKIATHSNYINYRFSNNPIIRVLTVPESVTVIANGAFANMPLLTEVRMPGTAAVIIGDLAFAYCRNLSVMTCLREVSGDPSSYLAGTAVV